MPGPCKWSNSSSNTDDDDDDDNDADDYDGNDDTSGWVKRPWGKRRSRLWETLPTSLFSASAFRHSLHDLASAGSYTINLYLAHNHRTWSNHHKRDIGTFDLWKGSSLIWDLINRICSLFRNTHWFIILVLKSNLLKTVQPSGIILLQNELIGLGRVLPNKAENRVNLRLRHHPRWDWKK